MTPEEMIIAYLKANGLNITRYIDTFRHVEPGTVCISGRSMWDYGGHYQDWVKLREILADPACPIRMEHVQSAPTERPGSFERLIWKD